MPDEATLFGPASTCGLPAAQKDALASLHPTLFNPAHEPGSTAFCARHRGINQPPAQYLVQKLWRSIILELSLAITCCDVLRRPV